jgi:hypothetical protein
MRRVILRDDDTNALTPVECLDRLYRPFVSRGLPVNLATIPEVSLDARMSDGSPEGFLAFKNGHDQQFQPLSANGELVRYLRSTRGYHIVQHGLHHDFEEFNLNSAAAALAKVDRGSELLAQAGFNRPVTFVAPQDRFTRASLHAVSRRFRVISSGWFEIRRLPFGWWPRYALKKVRGAQHFRVGPTALLSHPGCLLSCQRDYQTMLDRVIRQIASASLTVLVTHWWEYFRGGKADEKFIDILHATADYLATAKDVKVITFSDLAAADLD